MADAVIAATIFQHHFPSMTAMQCDGEGDSGIVCMFDASWVIFILFVHFLLLAFGLNSVGALPSFSQPSPIPSDLLALRPYAPRCEGSVAQPQESEPGPAGSHETALKKFLSVSELALDREMAATYILGPFRLDAETDTLFRGGEPVSLGHRAVALLRVLVEQRGIPVSKHALMDV